jgi:HEAT repeat protein
MASTMGRTIGILALFLALGAGASASAAPADSARLARAKDFIADEQWSRAVAELRAAAGDAKEKSRDEVLYWLAHSLNQAGDSAAALEAIQRLERDYPHSLWVKPARSLRLDIAVHFRRDDVLWWTAIAPPAPMALAAPPPAPPAAPSPGASLPPPPPPPPPLWVPRDFVPDLDLRIQALGSLMRTEAARAIPLLGEIALESGSEAEARRAVFVLAQSGRPEAQDTIVRIATQGAEPVKLAAVRELGRFGGPEVSQRLLQVYATGDEPLKRQVVVTLGDRSESPALLRIAESETDGHLRESAILALGRAGAGPQLRMLYDRVPADGRRPVLAALANARAEDALIDIAEHERDPSLREEAVRRLRLMGTPKARAWLQKSGRIR